MRKFQFDNMITIMAVDDLANPGAKASADLLLIEFHQKIPTLAWEGLMVVGNIIDC